MPGRFLQLLIFVVIATLTGCAGKPPEVEGKLYLPAPQKPIDPSDEILKNSVQAFLAQSGAPRFSLYDYERVDLNGDGRRDALVLFKNPYGYWCGIYGCTMLVMKAGDKDFTLVNAAQPVRGPIAVSAETTNGWKNIIAHISGRWTETKDVALTFDGEKYPAHPSDLPPYLAFNDQFAAQAFPY